jgi:hypothetical protein
MASAVSREPRPAQRGSWGSGLAETRVARSPLRRTTRAPAKSAYGEAVALPRWPFEPVLTPGVTAPGGRLPAGSGACPIATSRLTATRINRGAAARTEAMVWCAGCGKLGEGSMEGWRAMLGTNTDDENAPTETYFVLPRLR